jgi:hypothetical protein
MAENIDIFDVQRSEADYRFIVNNGDLELDVLADIIETAKGVPFLGTLIKLGKVGINVIDLHFVHKLGKFLKMSENISDEKKEKFILSLDHNDYKRISRFLTQLLYQAEEDTKAELYGKIYRYRLLDLIDNDMMLRLSLVVSN